MNISFRCVSHMLCDNASSTYIYTNIIVSYQLEAKKHVVDTTCYHITASETLSLCLGTVYLAETENFLLKV